MRRVLRRGLIGAIIVGTLWLAILTLAGCFFFFTFPDPTDTCTLWLWWYGPGWTENFLYLGTGISIGFISGLVHVWLHGGGELAATGVAPIRGNRTGRILLVALALLMAVVGACTIVPKCRVTAVGWFRGETCARGLPTSYWLAEMRAVSTTKLPPGIFLDVRQLAIGYIGGLLAEKIGKDAVPGLVAILADPNSNEVAREAMVRTLGRIGAEAAEATPALIVVLKDRKASNHIMRYMAAEAIGQIGPGAKAAVPALLDAMNKGTNNPNDFVAALLKLGPAAKDAVPALSAILTNPNANAQSVDRAVFMLGQIESDAPELVAALKNPSKGVVSGLAVTMIHPESKRESRLWAAAALSRIGPEAKEAVPILAGGLKNAGDPPHEDWWRPIVGVLNQIDPEAEALARILITSDSQSQWGADFALGHMGAGAKKAVPALVEALKTENEYQRRRIIGALNKLDPEAARKAGAN